MSNRRTPLSQSLLPIHFVVNSALQRVTYILACTPHSRWRGIGGLSGFSLLASVWSVGAATTAAAGAVVASIQWCWHTVVQAYRGAGIQWCFYTLVWAYSGACIQWCRHTVVHAYSVACIQWCMHTVLHVYSGVCI